MNTIIAYQPNNESIALDGRIFKEQRIEENWDMVSSYLCNGFHNGYFEVGTYKVSDIVAKWIIRIKIIA